LKPLWREGLYVMPQHFQAFDEYLEQEVDQRIRDIEPHGFGLSELELDEEALIRGVYQVRRLAAVMPDGMRVIVGPEHRVKEAVVMVDGTIAGAAPKGRRAEVHLGVPSDSSRGSDGYAGEPGAVDARWVRVQRVFRDAYGTADDADIECIRPNAQLILGSSDRRSYVTIKLSELELSENGQLAASESYVPPCLAISASPVLMARLQRLITAMGAKQDALASRYRGRTTSLVEFGAVDMATFWYLHTLNVHLPRLMHLARVGRVHPERLYLALAEIAGSLSTFEPQREQVPVPPYNHVALAETLFPIFDQIHSLLATVIGQQYKPIPLEQVQPGLFVAQRIEPELLKKYQLYLIAGGEVPEQSLRKDLPTFVRISSVEQITHVVQAAVPGLEVKLDLSPPTAIPVKKENVYLRLGQKGAHWTDILKTSSIAVFQPVSPKLVTLELVAVEL
jgi:type VI secretion system protein ImpJ